MWVEHPAVVTPGELQAELHCSDIEGVVDPVNLHAIDIFMLLLTWAHSGYHMNFVTHPSLLFRQVHKDWLEPIGGFPRRRILRNETANFRNQQVVRTPSLADAASGDSLKFVFRAEYPEPQYQPRVPCFFALRRPQRKT